MPTIDLTTMTSQELEELAHAIIARELHQRDHQEKREVTTRIREAKSVGVTVDIALAAKTSESALPKYRHPDDPTKTWTSRGKRPGWLTALLAEGRTLEEMEISR